MQYIDTNESVWYTELANKEMEVACGESKNPGTVTIKKLCDGLEITLGEFFSTPEFDELEQEIK